MKNLNYDGHGQWTLKVGGESRGGTNHVARIIEAMKFLYQKQTEQYPMHELTIVVGEGTQQWRVTNDVGEALKRLNWIIGARSGYPLNNVRVRMQ